ncbi:MAG: hypothetical protein IJ115_07725 [Erysipelotrichaceae bacterium]|nr:hypothetical protein [Erysipelotrichaceae bacterium]
MKKIMRKILILTLALLTVLTFTSCKQQERKNKKTASQAVEKYLSQCVRVPSIVSENLPVPSECLPTINQMISELEYQVTGERDYEGETRGIEKKVVSVIITGYDIGKYARKYIDTRNEEVTARITEETGLSAEEQKELSESDYNTYHALSFKHATSYFNELIDECLKEGKTYTAQREFVFYYDALNDKMWKYDPDFMETNINSLTNDAFSALDFGIYDNLNNL